MGHTPHAMVETLEDRQLFSAIEFTIDTARSYVFVSGSVNGQQVVQQRTNSLRANFEGTVRADVTPAQVRFIGGSSVELIDKAGQYAPFGLPASIAGRVNNISTPFGPTDAFFALRDASFDLRSQSIPRSGVQFDTSQINIRGAGGTADFEASGLISDSRDLAGERLASPTTTPSTLTSYNGVAEITLPIQFTLQEDVPLNGQATVSAVGQVVAVAHNVGGVSGSLYNDRNDDGIKNDGYFSPTSPTSSFKVYADLNRNGRLDTDEPWAHPSSSTGNYFIPFVPSGPQDIRVTMPSGWRHSAPTNGVLKVTVLDRSVTTGRNLLVTSKSSISGTVWADANKNGSIDMGEARWSNVRVWVDLNGDKSWSSNEPSAVTDFKGRYTIRNVSAGTAVVRLTLPSGNRVTTPVLGFHSLTVRPGSVLGGINFGTTSTSFFSRDLLWR